MGDLANPNPPGEPGQRPDLSRADFEAAIQYAYDNPLAGDNWQRLKNLCRYYGIRADGALCNSDKQLGNRAGGLLGRSPERTECFFAEIGVYAIGPQGIGWPAETRAAEVRSGALDAGVMKALSQLRPPLPSWIGTRDVLIVRRASADFPAIEPLRIVTWGGGPGGAGSRLLQSLYPDPSVPRTLLKPGATLAAPNRLIDPTPPSPEVWIGVEQGPR